MYDSSIQSSERLVVEMQDRLGEVSDVISAGSGIPGAAPSPVNDAISALVALGYRQADADRMVKNIATDGMPSENLIREALKAAKLLTRDSRAKERKKAGQPGARKRFQFSKR